MASEFLILKAIGSTPGNVFLDNVAYPKQGGYAIISTFIPDKISIIPKLIPRLVMQTADTLIACDKNCIINTLGNVVITGNSFEMIGPSIISLQAGATGISAGRFVKMQSTGLGIYSSIPSGGYLFGVNTEDCKPGASCKVVCSGRVEVETGGPIKIGDMVCADSSGQAIVSNGNEPRKVIAVTHARGGGGFVDVVIL